ECGARAGDARLQTRPFAGAQHRARSSRKKTPPHCARPLSRRELRPDRGRLRLAPKRSVAPVERHPQQPECAQTLKITGGARYAVNILIGGRASKHGNRETSPLSRILRWKRYCKGNRRVTFRGFV